MSGERSYDSVARDAFAKTFGRRPDGYHDEAWIHGYTVAVRAAAETPATQMVAQQGQRRAYHAKGTYWSGVPTMDMPCDFCARPFVDHDPRTHACMALDAWDRMFDAWVKYQAGLPSDVPLWPNPEWPQDVAMVAHALATIGTKGP